MKIILGSTSDNKKNVVKNVFMRYREVNVVGFDVDSGVTDQPLDEATTIKGAINRAKEAIKKYSKKQGFISVGMEGGLSLVNGIYHLVCVVVIIEVNGNKYIGISKKIPLPKKVSNEIKKGKQFGIVIRQFEKRVNKKNTKLVEHISELVSRNQSFAEALNISLFQLNNKKIFT